MIADSVIEAATIQAYQETEYRVNVHPPFSLRVDEACPALAGICKTQNVECSAFVTAYNPFSEALDQFSNLERHVALGQELERRGLVYFEGIGQHLSSHWPGEESYLVLSIALEAAKRLGNQLEQNAILWIGADSIPKLILLR